MRKTIFITTTITNHIYNVTAFNKDTNELETVTFATKVKGDSDEILKLFNKSHKDTDLIGVKADFNKGIEQMYAISTTDFIKYGEEIENG